MNERPFDPMDVPALAELDANLPDTAEAVALRRADPRAAEVLDALSATRAELAALPEPEVPPAVAMRWSEALAAERAGAPHDDHGRHHGDAPGSGPRPARSPSSAPRRRSRPHVVVAALAAAAAAAAAAVGVVAVRAPGPEPPVLTLSRVDLVAVGTAAVGTVDLGALADPERREACLHAVLPDAAGERLLGGRRVVLDGRPGVLLVLATGVRGRLHLVTVDPDCGPAGGTLIAQVTVG